MLKTSGMIFVGVGALLLVAAWQLDSAYTFFGYASWLIEDGGNLNYIYHLQRDRFIATVIGAALVAIGALLYVGGRIIERNV